MLKKSAYSAEEILKRSVRNSIQFERGWLEAMKNCDYVTIDTRY